MPSSYILPYACITSYFGNNTSPGHFQRILHGFQMKYVVFRSSYERGLSNQVIFEYWHSHFKIVQWTSTLWSWIQRSTSEFGKCTCKVQLMQYNFSPSNGNFTTFFLNLGILQFKSKIIIGYVLYTLVVYYKFWEYFNIPITNVNKSTSITSRKFNEV